ncbi:MAG: hypothetical protein ACFFG0_36680 [Candidatus Thorarchaeota archaeon]
MMSNSKFAEWLMYILEEYEPHFSLDDIGKNDSWKENYQKRKFSYIRKVKDKYGFLPDTILFWKLSKIKERFPLE